MATRSRNWALSVGIRTNCLGDRMAAFYYLTVNCKTANCSVFPLAEVGPAEPLRAPFIPRCDGFKAVCPRCMKEHFYSEHDLMFHKRERYPSVQYCRSYSHEGTEEVRGESTHRVAFEPRLAPARRLQSGQTSGLPTHRK